MTILDGKAYQTKSSGETFVMNDEHKTSFAVVTFFKADSVFYNNEIVNQKTLFEFIDKSITNKNGMYAIKITGNFEEIKTRAFPPVQNEPFPPLTNLLDKQQFFEHKNTTGTLVGYYFPEYLNGINVSGLHFHFLSSDKKQGGHLLDFKGKKIKIEIAEQKEIQLEMPKNKDFQNFQFRKKTNKILEKVE